MAATIRKIEKNYIFSYLIFFLLLMIIYEDYNTYLCTNYKYEEEATTC